MNTTIQKWGNSQGIRIPKALLEALNWNGDEEISISVENGKIVIEKAHDHKNIMELFADFHGEYQPVEMDWGAPVGEEAW